MLRALAPVVDDAVSAGRTVPAFTCYNLEQIAGVVEAAQSIDTPFCFLLAEAAFRSPHGEMLARALVQAAETATVEVAVQLDHTQDLRLIESAFAIGATAVMADGSKLDLEANIQFTNAAVRIAARHCATVEGELGHIVGGEDAAAENDPHAMTDPGQAQEFVGRSGVDLLAVAIGNVHGSYRTEPCLDLHRLREIHDRVHIPLTLHGTSGLPDAQVTRALNAGIRKINVNTELRQAYFAAARREFTENNGWSLMAASEKLTEATRTAALPHLRRSMLIGEG